MKVKEILEDLKKKIPKRTWTILGGILLCGVIFWVVQLVRTSTKSIKFHSKIDFSPSHYFSDLSHSFENIQAKVERIRKSAEENERLRLENINLKLNLESVQQKAVAKSGKQSTEEFELKLGSETGARVGRALSSINYKAPPNLFPSQLYTLALSYFVAREDEKAAVIFTLLTGQEANTTYKTAKDLLMTGVSWYRIENLNLADYYFEEVLKLPENEVTIQHQAQARLWKAIVADKLEKKHKAQYWLKELIDHHPNSNESKWINALNIKEEKHDEAKAEESKHAEPKSEESKHPEPKSEESNHAEPKQQEAKNE